VVVDEITVLPSDCCFCTSANTTGFAKYTPPALRAAAAWLGHTCNYSLEDSAVGTVKMKVAILQALHAVISRVMSLSIHLPKLREAGGSAKSYDTENAATCLDSGAARAMHHEFDQGMDTSVRFNAESEIDAQADQLQPEMSVGCSTGHTVLVLPVPNWHISGNRTASSNEEQHTSPAFWIWAPFKKCEMLTCPQNAGTQYSSTELLSLCGQPDSTELLPQERPPDSPGIDGGLPTALSCKMGTGAHGTPSTKPLVPRRTP
jgi:hypothetical protein